MVTKGGIVAAVSGLVLSLAAPATLVRAQVVVDEPGLQACRELKGALESLIVSRDGPGFRARLFKVRDLGARSSDPYLRNALSNLPGATNVDQLITWTKVTIDICVNRTSKPSTIILGPGPAVTRPAPAPTAETPPAPARPITPQDAEEIARRAAEKTGAKKCETKVYGGGAAVTVCE